MIKADTILTNGVIVTDYKTFRGSLAIKDGKIWKILEENDTYPSEETIDLEGNLLLPGLVDCHVHFNEPGREEWEGYTPGSFSAAAGGITTILEMPFNAFPPTKDISLLKKKREAVIDKSVVDYGHWALLENSNLEELQSLHEAGVVGFKGFMCDPGEFDMIGTFELYHAMELVAELGNTVGVHAENESLLQGFTERMKNTNRKDPRAWAESRPPVVELEALERAVLLATQTGCHLHVVHISTPQGFEVVQWAKTQGFNVTGETCPHYLALDEDDLARLGPVAKCSPPIRKRELVEGVWNHVLKGHVDVISSDHSPCTMEQKLAGTDDIWKAWGGMNSIQVMLPVLMTEGVHKRGLSLNNLVKMTSLNPARLFGLYPDKGHLMPGADADLIVMDLTNEWTLTLDMLFSRHKMSPYEGKIFKGMVKRTIVRGETVFLDGEIVAKPGYGQLVKRSITKYSA